MLRLLSRMDAASEAAGWGEKMEFHLGRGCYLKTFSNKVDIRCFQFRTGKEKTPTKRGIVIDSFIFSTITDSKEIFFKLWPALKCGTLCHNKYEFYCYECNPGLAGRGFKP